MVDDDKKDDVQDSPFNGSLDTLARINELIKDVSVYRVNNHWLGMKENLGELLNEGQGCLNKAEYVKAWRDWGDIDKLDIMINEDGTTTFNEELPVLLKRFSSWIRLKLYRHNLTMAKTGGSLDKLQLLHKRYGIKMKKEDFIKSMDFFAETIYKLSLSDRDINIGVGGFTGEGKSCFLTKLFMVYAKYSKIKWGFDRMTWSRKELLKWIDGDKKDKSGQLPEYSSVLVDELFMLFYKRNWYDEGQIDSIATLNMCRDRHLLIGGNIPNFWDLDSAFNSRIRFYIYIPYRGVAWVFEQENNPFSNDVWNRSKNEKGFRKFKNPYFLPNFLCEIHFSDWSVKEKQDYYKIRNLKRLSAIDVNKTEKIERYRDIKKQRDDLIRLLLNTNKKLKNKDLSDLLGISGEAVRLIREGLR